MYQQLLDQLDEIEKYLQLTNEEYSEEQLKDLSDEFGELDFRGMRFVATQHPYSDEDNFGDTIYRQVVILDTNSVSLKSIQYLMSNAAKQSIEDSTSNSRLPFLFEVIWDNERERGWEHSGDESDAMYWDDYYLVNADREKLR